MYISGNRQQQLHGSESNVTLTKQDRSFLQRAKYWKEREEGDIFYLLPISADRKV